MKKIEFIKMNGAGNDFVFLNGDKMKTPVSKKLAQKLLDRHFGVGGDQLLLLKNGKKKPEVQFFNSDGSRAEMCGNGIRAVAHYLNKFKGVKRDFTFKTLAGPIGIGFKSGKIHVDMGEPRSSVAKRTLTVKGKKFNIQTVSMGNPHCIVYVPDVERFPVEVYGPLIEHHSSFPNRTNVEFVQVKSKNHVKARVWERGAGETLACGTGACALAVVGAHNGRNARQIKIDLPGGQLGVNWAKNNHVYLTGPAEINYEGEFYV